jgi:hypothetical protein
MDPALIVWRRRHKRTSRRLWREVRLFLPLLGLFFCFGSSATVIVAAENLPLPFPLPGLEPEIPDASEVLFASREVDLEASDDVYWTISRSSTSKVSAAPAGMRPVLRLP